MIQWKQVDNIFIFISYDTTIHLLFCYQSRLCGLYLFVNTRTFLPSRLVDWKEFLVVVLRLNLYAPDTRNSVFLEKVENEIHMTRETRELFLLFVYFFSSHFYKNKPFLLKRCVCLYLYTLHNIKCCELFIGAFFLLLFTPCEVLGS